MEKRPVDRWKAGFRGSLPLVSSGTFPFTTTLMSWEAKIHTFHKPRHLVGHPRSNLNLRKSKSSLNVNSFDLNSSFNSYLDNSLQVSTDSVEKDDSKKADVTHNKRRSGNPTKPTRKRILMRKNRPGINLKSFLSLHSRVLNKSLQILPTDDYEKVAFKQQPTITESHKTKVKITIKLPKAETPIFKECEQLPNPPSPELLPRNFSDSVNYNRQAIENAPAETRFRLYPTLGSKYWRLKPPEHLSDTKPALHKYHFTPLTIKKLV